MKGLEVFRIRTDAQDSWRRSPNENPLSALFRVFGSKRHPVSCACRGPCLHKCTFTYSIDFEAPFPLFRKGDSKASHHLRVSQWVVGECLAMGIPPPEVPESLLDYSFSKDSCYPDVAIALTLIGKAYLREHPFVNKTY